MKSLSRLAAAACVALSPWVAPAGAWAGGIEGLWCGTGLLHEFSLRLTLASDEDVSGTLSRKQRKRELRGRFQGNLLRMQPTKVGSLVLELQGAQLRIIGGEGQLALAQGLVFMRANGPACAAEARISD